jgi:hypothetical protein
LLTTDRVLLVGDNPFQGVSHVSQERASSRENNLSDPHHAARLVLTSFENGADGFMFTVNKTTLAILKIMSTQETSRRLQLYALAPDVNEFVRTVAFSGGVTGLAKNLAKDMLLSKNWRSVLSGIKGSLARDPANLLRSYLYYETGRIRQAAGTKARLVSLMLHETVCDMALALNMEWLFKEHVNFTVGVHIKPGFETRNLSYLVKKFEQWGLDTRGMVIAAPFNAVGFQMCPSPQESENTLKRIADAQVIGFSILAGGYLSLPQAVAYTKTHSGLGGLAIGVSREDQARDTFKLFKEALSGK